MSAGLVSLSVVCCLTMKVFSFVHTQPAHAAVAQLSDQTCLMYMESWHTFRDKSYLEISWKVPDKLLQEYGLNGIQANVQWSFLEWPLDVFEGCTVVTPTSCKWVNRVAGSPNFDLTLNITVTEVSVANNTALARGNWIVDPENCTKPPKIDILTAEIVHNGCLSITWGYQGNSYPNTIKKEFMLQYRSEWDTGFQTLIFNYTGRYLACELVPYALYNITAQCIIMNSDGYQAGYWSDVAMTTIRTPQEVPDVGPTVTPGGFVSSQQTCMTTSERLIIVYWQHLPKRKQNGAITGYQLEVTAIKTGETTHYTVNDGLAAQADVMVSCDSDVRINIWSLTVVGRSVTSSEIFIPRSANVLLPIKTLIPEVQRTRFGGLRVSWVVPEDNINKTKVNQSTEAGYTVYWCQKSVVGTCKNALQWMSVPLADNSTVINNISTSPSMIFNRYIVGVSMALAEMTSGITWTDCIYDPHAAVHPPSDVVVNFNSGPPYSLTISWVVPSCSHGRPVPYVQFYLVILCEYNQQRGTCEGLTHDHRVRGESHSTVLKVALDTTYAITIISVTQSGNQSSPSDQVLAIPYNTTYPGVPLPVIVTLAIAAVFVLLGIILVIKKVHSICNPPRKEIVDILQLEPLNSQ